MSIKLMLLLLLLLQLQVLVMLLASLLHSIAAPVAVATSVVFVAENDPTALVSLGGRNLTAQLMLILILLL